MHAHPCRSSSLVVSVVAGRVSSVLRWVGSSAAELIDLRWSPAANRPKGDRKDETSEGRPNTTQHTDETRTHPHPQLTHTHRLHPLLVRVGPRPPPLFASSLCPVL